MTGDQFLSEYTDGLSHFGGVISYVWHSALSKALLFLDLPKSLLRRYGIHSSFDKAKSLLLIADAVSISGDGIVEKPRDEAEMIAQLDTILPSCAPYYMVIASLAMWGDGASGIGGSVDLVPLRVNPSLSDSERKVLKEKWILLYQSRARPLTPFGVSASSPEILPYMQVGLLPNRSHHITEYSEVRDFIGDPLRWVGTAEILEHESSYELATVMTGASPHGAVAAINEMIAHSWGIGRVPGKRRLSAVRRVAKMMVQNKQISDPI